MSYSLINMDRILQSAVEQGQLKLSDLLQQSNAHAQRMQSGYDNKKLGDGLFTRLEAKMSKSVFEYVAYYVPSTKDTETYPDLKEAIILDGKLLAETAEVAKTKVIRLIPTNYEPVIDKIKVEVRLFR